MKLNGNICGVVVGGIVTVIGTVICVKFRKLSKKIDNITKGLEDIADDIDLEVPEDIVKAAMIKAAERETEKVASREAKKVADTIVKRVDNTINSMYKDVEGELKESLKSKISMTTLDNIENKVVKDLIKKYINGSIQSFGRVRDISDVIRSCTEAGMSSYDITRVLKAMKGED